MEELPSWFALVTTSCANACWPCPTVSDILKGAILFLTPNPKRLHEPKGMHPFWSILEISTNLEITGFSKTQLKHSSLYIRSYFYILSLFIFGQLLQCFYYFHCKKSQYSHWIKTQLLPTPYYLDYQRIHNSTQGHWNFKIRQHGITVSSISNNCMPLSPPSEKTSDKGHAVTAKRERMVDKQWLGAAGKDSHTCSTETHSDKHLYNHIYRHSFLSNYTEPSAAGWEQVNYQATTHCHLTQVAALQWETEHSQAK